MTAQTTAAAWDRVEFEAKLRERLPQIYELAVEYLGTNLQIVMEVEKTSLFKFDREVKLIFDLAQFRSAPPSHLVEFLRTKIDELMDRKAAT